MNGAEGMAIEAVVGLVAMLGGYLVGSAPLARSLARSAGVELAGDTGRSADATAVWAAAGAGWGVLAVVGEIATGVVPVSLGMVTWSWGVAWTAGLGAVLGACWPAFGRRPGGRGLAVLGGAAFALAPAAGVVSIAVAVVAWGIARVARRNVVAVAVAAGLASFPPLFLLLEADLLRLAGVLALYLVCLVADARTRAPRGREER